MVNHLTSSKKTNFIQDMSSLFMDKVRDNAKISLKENFQTQEDFSLDEKKRKISTGSSLDYLEVLYDARVIENVKKALSGNRGVWRENLQKSQEVLLDYLQKSDNEEGRKYVANSLLDISERLIAVGKEDLKKFESNADNTYFKFAQRIYNNLDLVEKKKFWMDVYSVQQKNLGVIANSKLDHETEMKALKSLVKYCNVFINGLDSEQKDSLLDVKDERSKAILKLRGLRTQEIEAKTKENKEIKHEKTDAGKLYDREYALIQM